MHKCRLFQQKMVLFKNFKLKVSMKIQKYFFNFGIAVKTFKSVI